MLFPLRTNYSSFSSAERRTEHLNRVEANMAVSPLDVLHPIILKFLTRKDSNQRNFPRFDYNRYKTMSRIILEFRIFLNEENFIERGIEQ